MTTSELFKKHFNEEKVVGLKHPNIESFFEELNQICIQEDIDKGKRPDLWYPVNNKMNENE